MGMLISFGILFAFAFMALMLASWWKILDKTGRPGWGILIPIFNVLLILEITGKPWWWILLLLIPIVDIIYAIWVVNLLAKSFGKSKRYTLGIIFFPYIFIPMLAFGEAIYNGPAGNNS